jgi:hypothetical protein
MIQHEQYCLPTEKTSWYLMGAITRDRFGDRKNGTVNALSALTVYIRNIFQHGYPGPFCTFVKLFKFKSLTSMASSHLQCGVRSLASHLFTHVHIFAFVNTESFLIC